MKHFRSAVSLTLAAVMAVCVSLLCSVPMASAASNALAVTRYRYPVSRFENANFTTGAIIDKNSATAPYLFTDSAKQNGKGTDMLFAATVENYSMFNMKLGNNRALLINLPNDTDPAAGESYNSVRITMGKSVGTDPAIMPSSFSGIPTNSNDHGVMFHVEFTGTDGTINNGGYRVKNLDDKGNWLADKSYSNHSEPYVGFTFQEWDYKANGSVRKKAGTEQSTALHMKAGAKLTLVWTKSVSYTEKDKMTVMKKDANGKGIKNSSGEYVYEEIIPANHKAGDVVQWTCETYDYTGAKNDSGTMNLPRDFCGYVICPFSQMDKAWSSEDADGKITFRNFCYMYFTTSLSWNMEGKIWLDEFCLYGSSFAKCNNAYDYGSNLSYANHKDSMINRKQITVQAQTSKVTSTATSVATSAIKTAVTLKSADGKVILEAPSSAKLTNSTKFVAEAPENTDFNKSLFAKLFGSDTKKYSAYTIYLGKDGDIEPADYCKLTLPIPDGIDATKAAVYSVDGEVKTRVGNAIIDAAKKKITIPVKELGIFVVAEGSEEASASGTTSEVTSQQVSDTAESGASTASVAESSTATKSSTSLTWLWIVIAVVVVAGAVVAILLVMRNKKNGGSDTDPTDPENEEADDTKKA